MKKVFAILLVLTLLIPMALVPVANAGEVAAKPFYVLGWSDYNNQRFPYMDGLVTSGINTVDENVRFYIKPADGEYYGVVYGSYTDADVTAFAQGLKRLMDARPEGMRYWHLWGPGKALGLKPESVIYLDYGVDQMKEMMEAIVKKYYELGGKMDGIVIDTEYTGLGAWYIHSRDAVNDPLIYKKIVDDPRYATEVRPLLVERGFQFYDGNITDYTPEIYSISHNTGAKYDDARSVWGTVMSIRLKQYLNEWCFQPMITYFPDATLSDYQSTDMAAWLKGVNDEGNTVGTVAGNTIRGGNTSNYNFYANRPSTDFFKDSQQMPVFKNPASYTEAVYEMSPYNMFMYDINLVKRMYASTDTKNLSFWICEYDYEKKVKNTVSNTPYYTEEILHMGLYNPQPFLGYLYDQSFKENGKVSVKVYEDRCAVINEIMAELTRVAGYADRTPIEVPQNWNQEFILSGMYCGGRNLWRITPNTELVSKESFKVEGSDPTFKVAGQTITFPGGKIIEDGNISVVGTCGYWVETAATVTPIVTNDADRLVKKAAFRENFESYAVGTKLTTMNARDAGGWIIQPKGNDLLVEEVEGNKVLSITGNSVFRNQLIPANVTLADHYAPRQVWEVTVTVPAGMTAEETLTLLNYDADGQSDEDGGYQITGGKVYYSENGAYKELFDVSAGGKYTFRREMDLEKVTCSYVVTDGSGAVVAKAENVTVPAFTGTVNSLGITCQKVTGKVLLDDFALRASGVGTDFDTYDAKSGLKLAADTSHTAAAAYRFSWTNVDAVEKTETLLADIYEGDVLKETKIIKEVKLTQGGDGVETGIVEVAEGQSIKLYLKAEASPDAPGTDAPQPTETQPAAQTDKGGIDPLVIVLIVVVIAAVAAVVLVLVLTKKKPEKNG